MLMPVLVAPLTKDNAAAADAVRLVSLVDTGATGCCITSNAAHRLAVQPQGNVRMRTAAGDVRTNSYWVGLHIPSESETQKAPDAGSFWEIEAAETSPHEEYDVIVGMDVIMRGTLHVSGERFVFEFNGGEINGQNNCD